MALLPPIRLTGAAVLCDGSLRERPLALAGGRIEAEAPDAPLIDVDLTGFLVLPGIVDLHCDEVERHLAPCGPGGLAAGLTGGLAEGLAAFDREAAEHGVTTAWMAQGWSWEGGRRGPGRAEALLAALDACRGRALTDLRVQIRAETHLTGDTDRLIAAVARYGVDYVVFGDRLDAGIAMLRAGPGPLADWARGLGRTPGAMRAAIAAARQAGPRVPRSLCRLAEAFERLGVVFGSHDDPDVETRERFRMLGAVVAEFPASRAVAEAAQAMRGPVVLGAPEVVRGQCGAGNVAARDLVAAGLCDALVSGDQLPALARAAWSLVDEGGLDLPRAWALISAGPAAVLRLGDRGRLGEGLRADLVVVDAETRAIGATIAGGRLSHLSGEAARRFLAQPGTSAHLIGDSRVAAE